MAPLMGLAELQQMVVPRVGEQLCLELANDDDGGAAGDSGGGFQGGVEGFGAHEFSFVFLEMIIHHSMPVRVGMS